MGHDPKNLFVMDGARFTSSWYAVEVLVGL
jgi:hypothetical protein